jgi:hypothetical protein
MEDNSSKKILLTVLGVAILIVAVVGISFALFTSNDNVTGENTIKSGTVTMSFSEKTNGITLSNALPMSEADALQQLTKDGDYFDFDVVTKTSKAGTVIPYKVSVAKISGDLTDDQIAINLQKLGTDGNYTSIVSGKKVSEMANGVIVDATDNAGTASGKTDSYRLRIWIAGDQDASAIASDSKYSLRVNVNGGV